MYCWILFGVVNQPITTGSAPGKFNKSIAGSLDVDALLLSRFGLIGQSGFPLNWFRALTVVVATGVGGDLQCCRLWRVWRSCSVIGGPPLLRRDA